jgi:hypothetical protein
MFSFDELSMKTILLTIEKINEISPLKILTEKKKINLVKRITCRHYFCVFNSAIVLSLVFFISIVLLMKSIFFSLVKVVLTTKICDQLEFLYIAGFLEFGNWLARQIKSMRRNIH